MKKRRQSHAAFGVVPCFLLLTLLSLASAQAPLDNNGTPMRVPFECTSDDTQAAGLDCSQDQPCPVYLELSGLETVGVKIFLAGNLHTEVATLDSILLQSTDGGKTWTEPQARMRATVLDWIQFIDFQNGWISGWAVQPLPRDPYLLATGDGGKTWKKQAIFDDGRSGAIEQFNFDSPTSGTVLIDTGAGLRHQIYETMTGGATWVLRHESEEPIPFPQGRSRDAYRGWRLRADAKTKTHVLEKSQDETWKPVARFLIAAGACRQ